MTKRSKNTRISEQQTQLPTEPSGKICIAEHVFVEDHNIHIIKFEETDYFLLESICLAFIQ